MHPLAAILACLLLAFVSGAEGASPARVESVSFQGREYFRVSSWARENQFTPRWMVQDQELRLSNARHTLILNHDSRRIKINGVWVWISAPVIMRDRDAFIPRLDLRTTLQPLLFPRRSTGGSPRIICLDPGHGGDDTGKRDGNRYEKYFTLQLAKELGKQLTRAGYRVVYTRTSDAKVDLPVRPNVAQRARADLFLSLHFNGADVPSAQGVEVYCLTPVGASSTNAGGEGADSPASPGNRWDERNLQLAFELQKSLVRRLGREDRGLRRARFAVLRDATMPAVLIEGGFMSNPAEARWIYSASERTKLARAIVEAVNSYKGITGS